MFDKFRDYMYYLLTTPFKRIPKQVNNWYILCRVLGGWFDDCMADLYTAQSESMLAGCQDLMLQVHAADRNMSQYEGETADNYRVRIAGYTEIKRLGGTQEGVLKAVKSLGYDEVRIVRAADLRQDQERWAEYYVIMDLNIDDKRKVPFDVLKREVRRVKYSAAKDNYLYIHHLILQETAGKICMRYRCVIIFKLYDYLMLDGSWCLDGQQILDVVLRKFKVSARHVIRLTESSGGIGKISYKHNYWTLDGTYQLDGSKMLDAYEEEEL